MKFEPEMREARLQVHHRQSFKAPGNNTAAMVGAWCYINIDPQLERGELFPGVLSPVTRRTKVRGGTWWRSCDKSNDETILILSCHPRQYESDGSSVTLDRQQQSVLLLSCGRVTRTHLTVE